MSTKGARGDISAILLVLPFALSGVYAIYLWALRGVSLNLPSSVYLTVTRDPIVFAVGTFAVLAAVVIEEISVDLPARQARLEKLGSSLQTMAIASLALALLSALYANGADVSAAANDFVVGRYGLAFPVMLFLFSFLITAKFQIDSVFKPKVLGLLAFLGVPVVLYGAKRIPALGLTAALVLVVAGILLLLGTRLRRAQQTAA